MIRNFKHLILYTLVILTGCSVKYSFTGASIPPEAKTVSVFNFVNQVPQNPLLSIQLTEALKDRFMSESGLTIVTDRKGDLHFEGVITQYNTRPIDIQAGSDQAQKNRFTIGVKVKFENALDQPKSYDSSFSRFADYESSQSFFSVESTLTSTIVEELVDDIFNKAVVNW